MNYIKVYYNDGEEEKVLWGIVEYVNADEYEIKFHTNMYTFFINMLTNEMRFWNGNSEEEYVVNDWKFYVG